MNLRLYVASVHVLSILIASAFGRESGNVKQLERTYLLGEESLKEFAKRQIEYLAGRYSNADNLTDYYNVQYTMEIGIGTPEQKFKVSPDTGSSDLWVYSSDCLSYACLLKPKYDSSQSSTYEANDGILDIGYGSGSVLGIISIDNVHVTPSLVAVKQGFGEIMFAPNKFALWKMEGIFGLAFPYLSQTGYDPPFKTLIEQRKVSKPIFSIYLNRDLTSRYGGEIMFGGIDRSHINGSGIKAPLTKLEWFLFGLKEVCFGAGKCANVVFRNGDAIADSGTSLIGGPASIVRKINSEIIGGTRDSMGLYDLDCSKIPSLPPVTFKLEHGSLTIHAKSYILHSGSGCFSGFQELNTPNGPKWILGDVLLGEFYTVYDMGSGSESVTFYPVK